MKNRVGTLYGKPVVIGDKNLVTDNEIYVSTLKSNEAGDTKIEYCYYKVKEVSGDAKDMLRNILYTYLNITNIICHFLVDKYSKKYVEMPFSSYANNPTYDIRYIKHNPNEHLMYVSTYASLIVKGDLYEVFDIYVQYMIDKMGNIPQEQIDEMKNTIFNLFTPCTKEEYEGIINVFPLNKQ